MAITTAVGFELPAMKFQTIVGIAASACGKHGVRTALDFIPSPGGLQPIADC
jgi:hypothetical protein